MFSALATIGTGVLFYGLCHIVSLCLVDCDLELAFYSKFGKSPSRLKGKVVFITGASSGIGEYIARAFAKHGVRLVLTARRIDELNRVKNICIELSGGQLTDKDVLVIPMDMLDIDSHRRHFARAVNHFGGVDVLVNNAGRSQRALWDQIELTVDRQIFDLNVFSVVNLSRVAIEHFNARGSGQLAVVTSIAGLVGVPYSASYTGSKHAVHGYFNSLRSEKVDGKVSTTILCPGPTYTNFLSESFTGKEGQKYGVSAKATDRRMTAERCGELSAIAITNKLDESWMGLFPVIPFTYLKVYCPIISRMIHKIVGPSAMLKLREGRRDATLTEVQKSQ